MKRNIKRIAVVLAAVVALVLYFRKPAKAATNLHLYEIEEGPNGIIARKSPFTPIDPGSIVGFQCIADKDHPRCFILAKN